MNGRLNFYFLLSHTYVLCAQTVLISASCRIFLGLKSFWHFPTLFIRSIEQIFGLCKGHIIVDYCFDLGGKSDTCWLHTISIGKQCKELLDYNDNIGFIFHDDAKKLDRPAKNRYSA